MASMNFEISTSVRPCYVISTKQKALFHKWITVAEVIPPSNLRSGHHGGQIIDTYALVEFEDGRMGRIHSSNIRFDDGGKFNEHYWISEELDRLEKGERK